jgi:hypothetical protein
MRRIPTSWLHEFRRLNIGADGIDSVVEVTEVFLALDDTAIAISAEIVAVPISELAIEPLQFEHVPKKPSDERLAMRQSGIRPAVPFGAPTRKTLMNAYNKRIKY